MKLRAFDAVGRKKSANERLEFQGCEGLVGRWLGVGRGWSGGGRALVGGWSGGGRGLVGVGRGWSGGGRPVVDLCSGVVQNLFAPVTDFKAQTSQILQKSP